MAEPTAATAPAGAALPLIPRSEAKLVRLAAAGDERAFTAIFERYHQELYRFCRALLGDSHEAHDALQSTMASALRSLPGESRTIALRPWLYRVARNEAVTLMRRRRPLADVADTDMADLAVAPAADVVAESNQRLRSLVEDLTALPERQRSALVMRELSGLTYEQIGSVLEISPAAARQVLYEARMALQELEEGRAMQCEEARVAISARDGRTLRGRRIRSHLRSCEDCKSFRQAIDDRSADLELLAPPLSAVAASGLLASLLGGGSVKAGAGTLGGLLAGGASGGAVGLKSLGVVAATAAIGFGAGDLTGIQLPLPGGSASEPTPAQPVSSPVDVQRSGNSDAATPGRSASAPQRADGRGAATSRSTGQRKSNAGRDRGKSARGVEAAASGSAAGGASAVASAGGPPPSPPGQALAAERSSGAPGVAHSSAGASPPTASSPPAPASSLPSSSAGGSSQR